MHRHLATLGLLLLAPVAQAFTYQDEDVLIAFRKDGFDDVVFNLGSINQFLNRSNGEEITVTRWNPDLVRSKYDLNDEVKLAVLSTTAKDIKTPDTRRVWLSSAEPNTTPLDRTSSQWQLLWSKINSVGIKAQEFTQSSPTNAFTASPTLPSGYTYIISSAGTSASTIATLGGASAFKVESSLPADVKFYEVKPSTASPKPEAKLIGRFTLGTDGVLKFIAGTPSVQPPLDPVTITSISNTGDRVSVAFNSVAGAKYRLRYTDSPNTPLAGWVTATSSVDGTGSAVTLQDTATGAASRFYLVETYQ
jgi:hypothetical protein